MAGRVGRVAGPRGGAVGAWDGIGQALVRACLERARVAGAPVLCLHTAEFMTTAVALYERLGFRRAPAYDFDATRHLGLDGVRPVPILSYRNPVTGERGPAPGRGAARGSAWSR